MKSMFLVFVVIFLMAPEASNCVRDIPSPSGRRAADFQGKWEICFHAVCFCHKFEDCHPPTPTAAP